MIPYSRDPHATVATQAVRILGLGGAGANILDHIVRDGGDPTQLVLLNTDVRTLEASQAKGKIQLGINLTRGLGTGGDPDLGEQAVLEAEAAIRDQIRGCRIVFLCAGLGGGTGSGAAPIVTRIAREEGAFVVVFHTMPFTFEGKRRTEQAENALHQLAVLANALVTFDNNRMGELIVAQQGIHEAFSAADKMMGEAIQAVIRLVTRPGLIHIGLDDLMSALRTTRSRCLFGSGIAEGADRATKALASALNNPLLDQGALLRETGTVLVHLCGGENLTLSEIERLMQELQTLVPQQAQILFGAAVDASMGEALSVTVISSLPEEKLRETSSPGDSPPAQKAPSESPTPAAPPAPEAVATPTPKPVELSALLGKPAELPTPAAAEDESKEDNKVIRPRPVSVAQFFSPAEPEPEPAAAPAPSTANDEGGESPRLKLGVKKSASDAELGLDATPRGRFEGAAGDPFEGKDLDVPPFLRKK